VFAPISLWKSGVIGEVERYFVNALADEGGTFVERLHYQMAPSGAWAKQLLSEMLWLMLLCPSNIGAARKREDVSLVWGWSGNDVPESEWLNDDVLGGIGNAGQGFNHNRDCV
jgi:5-methylcytosine-specific restriction enzyme B